jgi:hypothetical protein
MRRVHMKFGMAVGIVLGVVGLSACGGGEAPKSSEPAVEVSKVAAAGGGETGVPECDAYIKKYEACVQSKVPEAARASVRQSLDQMKAAWKQAAASPNGKASLATGCNAALDAAKTSMGAYGCSW